jgi:hypothetical protein
MPPVQLKSFKKKSTLSVNVLIITFILDMLLKSKYLIQYKFSDCLSLIITYDMD